MIGWEIFYIIGAALLALGITYGVVRYYTRNRGNDPVTEASARAQYDNPDVDDAQHASENLRRKTGVS